MIPPPHNSEVVKSYLSVLYFLDNYVSIDIDPHVTIRSTKRYRCVTRNIEDEVKIARGKVLKSVTLQELVERHRDKVWQKR